LAAGGGRPLAAAALAARLAAAAPAAARTPPCPRRSRCARAAMTEAVVGAVPGTAKKKPQNGDEADGGLSVVEVFSHSAQKWFVGLIAGDEEGVVTVRFVDGDGMKRQKTAPRNDPQFARFGMHTGGSLPPSIVTVPSQSRPGQFSYFDQTVMRKFATAELAWQQCLRVALCSDQDTMLQSANRWSSGGSGSLGDMPEGAVVPSPTKAGAQNGGKAARESQARAAAEEFILGYVHPPVATTRGINYFNRVPIKFAKYYEALATAAAANAPKRAQLISIIEDGTWLRSSLDAFVGLDADGGRPAWRGGGVAQFVADAFRRRGLAPPGEADIQPLFAAFDTEGAASLRLFECLMLADAVARTVCLAEAGKGASQGSSLGGDVGAEKEVSVIPPNPVTKFFSGLSRAEQGADDGPARPVLYSTFTKNWSTMGNVDVVGVGLVDGAISVARLLIQRLPTSIVQGGPNADAIRLRLLGQNAVSGT